MGESRTIQFSVCSRTLEACFDLRLTLTPTRWHATVHPMDGASFQLSDEHDGTALAYFQQLLRGLERAPRHAERATG